jgi:Cu2+-exporting ATPase
MNAMLFSVPQYFGLAAAAPLTNEFHNVALGCGTLSFLIGGSYFFRRAWQGLRHGLLHIDLPISLGLFAAYLGSIYAWFVNADSFLYFDFVSTFTFLMLVGRWTQQKAIERNRNRLLDRRQDEFQVRVLPGRTKSAADTLKTGDHFLVEPGQTVPVRSKLTKRRR